MWLYKARTHTNIMLSLGWDNLWWDPGIVSRPQHVQTPSKIHHKAQPQVWAVCSKTTFKFKWIMWTVPQYLCLLVWVWRWWSGFLGCCVFGMKPAEIPPSISRTSAHYRGWTDEEVNLVTDPAARREGGLKDRLLYLIKLIQTLSQSADKYETSLTKVSY